LKKKVIDRVNNGVTVSLYHLLLSLTENTDAVYASLLEYFEKKDDFTIAFSEALNNLSYTLVENWIRTNNVALVKTIFDDTVKEAFLSLVEKVKPLVTCCVEYPGPGYSVIDKSRKIYCNTAFIAHTHGHRTSEDVISDSDSIYKKLLFFFFVT